MRLSYACQAGLGEAYCHYSGDVKHGASAQEQDSLGDFAECGHCWNPYGLIAM